MKSKNIEQKEIRPVNGYLMLILIGAGVVGVLLFPFLCYGLKIVNPNEAILSIRLPLLSIRQHPGKAESEKQYL